MSRIGLWLLALLLILSLAGNVLLGLLARHYYFELNGTQLDPVGLGVYPVGTPLPKANGKVRLLFYGDSRAYTWPAPTGFDQIEVLNRGIGGQTTAQILARFDDHLVPLQPDIVLIQAGINDLKTIGLFPAQRDAIIANCKKNLAAMVQRATAQGATVILTTVFPTAQPSLLRRPFWSDAVGEAIVEVNLYLKTLVGERVVLFDSAALLVGADGAIQPVYSYDLLHLNQAGYAALNAALRALLEERKVED